MLIDKQSLLEKIDLLSLVGGNLKRKASTNGGEFSGPCPMCGGSDRFNVQPYAKPWGLWLCRNCTDGKWQNAIDFIMLRDRVDFRRACELLSGGALPTTQERRQPAYRPAYSPTLGAWQEFSIQAISICYDNLRKPGGAAALDYLHSRGLHDRTIENFRLGYSPGARFGDLYIPRGVVIPCINLDEVWYLKILLLPGTQVTCHRCGSEASARKPCPKCGHVTKYTGVKGNRTAALFNADECFDRSPVLICEGEIDVMTAWQAIGDCMAVIGLGSAANRLDMATWTTHIRAIPYALILLDNDEEGRQGARYLSDLLGDKARIVALPGGAHDINDYHLAGGDLWKWAEYHLEELALI